MTLTQIADVADLIAAFGVVASLMFLAWELRKNSEQTLRANWQAILAGLREHKRRTDSPEVAKIVVRGRQDFDALEPWEQLTFNGYMEEMIQAYDGLLLHGGATVVRRAETDHAVGDAFRHHFSFPGSRAWWRWSGLARRWPAHLVGAVEKAIAAVEKDG